MAEDNTAYMEGDESLFNTPTPADAQRILAQTVRRNPALAMPTGGAPTRRAMQSAAVAPPASPGAGPAVPTANDLLRQLIEKSSERPDTSAYGEQARRRAEQGERDLLIGAMLGVKGGADYHPLSQALVASGIKGRSDQEIPGGWGHVSPTGEVVWNPAKLKENEEQRLTKLYGVMSAEETRRDLAKQQDQLRRDLAGQAAALRRDAMQQGKFTAVKDNEGNVTAIIDNHTGAVTYPGGGAGGRGAPVDVLPRNATSEEKNHYATAAELITTGGRLVSEIEQNPDAFGFTTGAASQIGAATGVPAQKMFISPEQEQLRAGVMQKAYEVINKLAGAALSATEAGRIMQFVPNPRDDAETITAKLKSAMQIANEQRSTLRQRYGMGAPQAGAPAAAPPARPPGALPKATLPRRAEGYMAPR